MAENDNLDVVFIVGPMGRKVHREISHVVQMLTRSFKDCRVASIYFESKYDSTLGKEMFYGHVSDFSNAYVDRSKSPNGQMQGNPLQHITGLSFRENALRICFLISNVLPFHDAYEETITNYNENGENMHREDGDWGQTNNTNHGDWGQTNTTDDGDLGQTNTAASVSTLQNTSAEILNLPKNNKVNETMAVDSTSENTEDKIGNINTDETFIMDSHRTSQEGSSQLANPNTNMDGNVPNTMSQPENKPAQVGSTAAVTSENSSSLHLQKVPYKDPLQTCNQLAAMGVVFYCIETNPNCSLYNDMYEAFGYITGGQYIHTNTLQISKAVKCTIMEEVYLERLVSNVKDYLCIAWLAWGRMKTRKPSSIAELSENLLNYFHNVNIYTPELLVENKSLKSPSKHAKKISQLDDIGAARRMKTIEDNWAAESSWLAVEVCNEVIPGYNTKPSRKQTKKVTLSKPKKVTRNQAGRILVRTLARRPGTIRKQLQQKQAIKDIRVNEERELFKKESAQVIIDDECRENDETGYSQEHTLSCKQDILIIDKENYIQDQICILV